MYIRDEWVRRTFREMGHESPRGRFVHLYLNGLYWGVYNLVERPDAEFFASREKGDYEVIKEGKAIEGNDSSWKQLIGDIQQPTPSAAELVPSLRERIDFQNFVDYYVLNVFIANHDWGKNNWYASHNTIGADQRWRIYPWDSEFCLDGDFNRQTPGGGSDTPVGGFIKRIGRHIDIQQEFSDYSHRHFAVGGALSVEECRRRWDELARKIELAVVMESARWGDHRDGSPGTVPGECHTLGIDTGKRNARLWITSLNIVQHLCGDG